jgi:hypothetical protein
MSANTVWAELESTALMEEYRTLRAEIQQRVTNQLTIAGGNLALVAAAIQFVLPNFGITGSTLLLPILFAAVAWLYFEQDIFIIQAASYLHQRLRPAIIARLTSSEPGARVPDDVLAWESFRGDALFGQTFYRRFLWFMTAFRVIATAGPGLAILLGIAVIRLEPGIYPQALKRYNNDPILDVVLFVVDAALQIALLHYAFRVRSLYGTISGKSS